MFLAPFTVPVLTHPLWTAVSRLVFASQGSAWSFVAAFWNFTYLRSSIHGLYVGWVHILVVSLLMALVGDHTLPLLRRAAPSRAALSFFGRHAAAQCLAVAGCSALLRLPRFSHWGSRLLHCAGAVAGAVYQARMFHRLPALFPNADDRFVLIGALAMMHWVPIVDFAAQKVSRKRAVSRFRQFSLLVQLSIVAAVVFTLSRRSTLAAIFGIYPLQLSGVVLLLVYVILYLRVISGRVKM
jgi:hypothetical protein